MVSDKLAKINLVFPNARASLISSIISQMLLCGNGAWEAPAQLT